MIDADVSGVAFTRHPIIKDKDIMLIEAIYGLGEAIVSGMVTPDSYEISKTDCSIRDLSVSKQAVKVSQARTGTKISDVFEEDQSKQKLNLTRIKELGRVCKKIEKHYSSPQDIEWCYKNNNLYILQSRPITTL
jgi:pyruvate,water dikinase